MSIFHQVLSTNSPALSVVLSSMTAGLDFKIAREIQTLVYPALPYTALDLAMNEQIRVFNVQNYPALPLIGKFWPNLE